MEYSEFLFAVKTECQFLEKDGFKFRERGKNLVFLDETGNEAFKVEFFVTVYNYLEVAGLTVSKRFNQVEEIIHKSLHEKLGAEMINYDTIHLNDRTDNFEFKSPLLVGLFHVVVNVF